MTAISPRIDGDRPWDSHPDDFPKVKTNVSKPSQVASLIRQQIKRGMPDAPQGCSVISAGLYTRAESKGRDNYIEYTKERGEIGSHGLIRLDVHDKLSYDDRKKLFRMVCRVLHINNVRHSWSQSIHESISVWTGHKDSMYYDWMTGGSGGMCYRNYVYDRKAKAYAKDENGDFIQRKDERSIKPLFAYSEDL